jgi:RNA polymerase sigma-70 factor, ECF subfamily
MCRDPVSILTEEDRRRFEDIFLPYLDAAYNLARWMIQHEQDAQDIVQEAYLRAFKGFSQFRGGDSRCWFLTIVRNTAHNRLRRQYTERKFISYDEQIQPGIPLAIGLEDELVAKGRQEQLQITLERLPPEFRETIILHELEGLSYKELAAALHIPVGTVMSRLSRARRRLREACKFEI